MQYDGSENFQDLFNHFLAVNYKGTYIMYCICTIISKGCTCGQFSLFQVSNIIIIS